jgi:hypothetical protein
MECALQRFAGVLQPMACDVHQVRGWEHYRCLRGLGHGLGQGRVLNPGLLNDRADVPCLHLDLAKDRQTCVGGMLSGDQQELRIDRRHRLKALARAQESGERGRVRGDDVVGAAFLTFTRVDASRMNCDGGESASGAPVESRSPTWLLHLLQGYTSAMCSHCLSTTHREVQMRKHWLDHV